MKTPARINRIIATVPEMIFKKNNPAITTARSILTILSIDPIFFFICFIFSEQIITPQKSNNVSCHKATFVT